MAKRIISLALFVILFIASFGGSIYATVQASGQKALYDEQLHYVEKYESMYEKTQKSDNPILGSQYFKNLYQEKTEEAQKKAKSIKKVMRKYFSFAAILMFVAFAMMICSIVTAMPIIKTKKPDAKDELKEAPTPQIERKERPKSDFDIILEAPKPHISNEE